MTDEPASSALSVLHVVALVGSGGEFGGPVSVAEAQATELSIRGHSVVVSGLRRGPVRMPAGLTAAQWRTFPAWRVVPRSGMLGLTNARFLRFLWVAVGRADVVHVHAGRDLVSLSALLIARLRATPVVVQTHGMVLPRRHLRARVFDPVFLRLVRRASTVLYMTEGEREDLRSQLGPSARLRFLGNGVRLPPERPPPPPGTPTVLFLARLHPVKRVTAFAEMAALLHQRGVRAQFVAYGPDQGDLRNLLSVKEQCGLADDVFTYGGALDHERAVAALASAAVFVLPSSADWMPMSLLEALALGIPSVCTDSCGLAPVLQEAGAALVTDGSPESLADAVARILDDPVETSRLSRAGRAIVADRFCADAVVDELEVIYTATPRPADTNATTRSSPAVAERFSRE